MGKVKNVKYYPVLEEKLNVWSHGFGLVLSVFALILFIMKSYLLRDTLYTISTIVFALSMIILYSASTIYHNEKEPKRRRKLNIVDHAAIYVLIAGTYTPVCLVGLNESSGWLIFSIIWTLAIFGIIFKLFFTGRFNFISTVIYVFLGCLILFFIQDLVDAFPEAGLNWMLAGGVSYLTGAALYMIKKLPYNHATFHVFVLGGTFCHFISIYKYVLPQ